MLMSCIFCDIWNLFVGSDEVYDNKRNVSHLTRSLAHFNLYMMSSPSSSQALEPSLEQSLSGDAQDYRCYKKDLALWV